MSKMTSLQDLYVHELKDILSAEKQLTRALPKLAKAADSEELKSAFEEHLQQTETQVTRVEKILKRLGESASGPKCKGMEGLIAEGDEFSKEEATPAVLDAGMVVAAQKVEHYEIAAYGSLCTFAELLGFDEDLELLKQNLSEEEETDERLTEIGETLNEQAEQSQGGEEEENNDEEEMETSNKSKSRR